MIQPDKLKNFGHKIDEEHFHHTKSLIYCNHGSYGAVPKSILKRKQDLQLEIETAPDKWFRYTMFDLWTVNKQCLADYLHVPNENILILDNATDCINAALKSIEFNGCQDAILTTQYTYKAISNTVDYVSKYRLAEDNYVQVFQVPCPFPVKSKADVLNQFEKICEEIVNVKKLRLRVALVDHISSASATLFPVKEIVQIVRKWSPDALVMVDGAHSIGQIAIDLVDLDCDYYVSNLHKWFLAPRGCSFLYLKDVNRLAQNLQPNYISHGYDKSVDYNFCRRGTADKSSYFCVRECVDFYENELGGLATICAYTSKILDQAVDLITKSWQTNELDLNAELRAPYMRLVKLPYMKNHQLEPGKPSIEVVDKLQLDLIEKYHIISVVVVIQEELYIRLACFVYNELSDFEKLRDAVLGLQND